MASLSEASVFSPGLRLPRGSHLTHSRQQKSFPFSLFQGKASSSSQGSKPGRCGPCWGHCGHVGAGTGSARHGCLPSQLVHDPGGGSSALCVCGGGWCQVRPGCTHTDTHILMPLYFLIQRLLATPQGQVLCLGHKS